ncbi:hypothetical protein BMS3Abin04_01556 [bacterium BMS3Abin04]|nr:hypothetical protein BMS3Abin04_01556 [bacterium BMS3Abin04]
MKKYLISSLLIFLVSIFVSSCELKTDSTDNPTNPNLINVTITGQVVDQETGNGLGSATIKITDGDTLTGTSTGSDGKFVTTFGLDKDKDLTIIAVKPGFLSDTITVFATTQSSVEVPLMQLQRDTSGTTGGGGSTSGAAASIYLFSQNDESIGVKESGSLENTEITFEIRDSSGIPIDIDHAETVNFSFGSNPNGGEYLYPTSIKTNALGRATVVLNSGTIAGVVQVVAEINNSNEAIKSKPILIAIYGGLPDDGHFDVASDRLNYPKLGVIGYQIDFTAYVGDKFSNPVRPGTAVYFNTNSGIIDGSDLTDDLGRSTVPLLTQGFPVDSVYGSGFFTVTAYTADENLNTLTTKTTRMLSGSPILTVSPTSFNILNGGSQSFSYTCSDINGNPMSFGQSIVVSVKNGNIAVSGNVNVKLPDTQSRSATTYSFFAFDTKPDSAEVKPATIVIKSSGPNGETSISISGTGG